MRKRISGMQYEVEMYFNTKIIPLNDKVTIE